VGAEGVRVSPNARGVREYLKKEKKGGVEGSKFRFSGDFFEVFEIGL